jgi:hypothetical protein
MNAPPAPRIRDAVARVFIVAHREKTARLENELGRQGLAVTVLRKEDDAITREFSPNLRCLLNHAAGWEIAARSEGLSLFVEADFAPCRDFGNLPLPFDPSLHGDAAWAYVYAGGPRIYAREASGHLLAHACSTVAYVVPPRVARMGLVYLADLRNRHPDWRLYHAFDTELQWYLMGYGAKAYVPWRQLGEHGGRPNPEHFGTGMGASRLRRLLARAGVGLNHYADALAGPLAFSPDYAAGGRLRLLRIRAEGRVTGLLRLLLGKTMKPITPLSRRERLSLAWCCLRRLVG